MRRTFWFVAGAALILWLLAPGAEAQATNDDLMDGLIKINDKLNDQDTVLQRLTADLAGIEARVEELEQRTNSSLAGLENGMTSLDLEVQALKTDLVQVRTQLVGIEEDTSRVEEVQATTQNTNEQVSKTNNLGWFIAIQVAVLMGFFLRANPDVLRIKRNDPAGRTGSDDADPPPFEGAQNRGAQKKQRSLKDRASKAFTNDEEQKKKEKGNPLPDDLEEQLQANKEAKQKVAHTINGSAPMQKHIEERDRRMMAEIDAMAGVKGRPNGA